MKKIRQKPSLESEFLILPNGRIYVQNLTQPMAGLLHRLNRHDEQIAPRTKPNAATTERRAPARLDPAQNDSQRAERVLGAPHHIP